LEENVITAYHFIATNWHKGDEIYLFGFSRGAYTARALRSILTQMGVLYAVDLEYFRELYQYFKEHGNSIKFNNDEEEGTKKHPVPKCQKKLTENPKPAVVSVIGVWDTVGSLGLPESFLTDVTGINKRNQFWNTALNKREQNNTTAFQVLPR
jgi:uncharacterized protein (DUF2235 family)